MVEVGSVNMEFNMRSAEIQINTKEGKKVASKI